ncbi:putative dimethyl sulfoxide reductase iron-sulfur subunit B [Candidatus Methanobinarius endosymbioticus]|uniref:Putative dimethyl sulfoxide reductase iron-sulfur subunit B n=1 Tax=Candidatus Methanobinarius endosymbioticus TaxID=2006182 RepID=A0A366MAV9_9EURY|nr:putative dimethyl sulfoxide reductase iron-sulfur subunit B [Candidatus Methanobinarius endosymbioticus]
MCNGCLDCENACYGLYGASRIIIKEIDGTYYPIVCQQCEDAPCKAICPTEAIKGKGVEEDKCIACGLCMIVCPFGAVTLEERKAQKCNQCEGREDGPACIKACSKRAISLVDVDKMKSKKQDEYLSKLAGVSKKPKSNSILNVLTSGTRCNKAYKDKE